MKSFTYAQYIALGMAAPETGPFAMENRAPWDQGGRGNYYASRGTTILGIVMHISAGLENMAKGVADKSAEGLASWGSTTTNQASWPVCVDSDSIVNCLHPLRVAWLHGVSGYNFNRPLWGMEICKLHSNWDTAPSWWVDAVLRNAAAAAAPIVKRYGIPLRVMTDRDEIQRLINAGIPVGFTEHWRLTPGTRQDAGRVGNRTTFPWARFFAFLRTALAQMEGRPSAPQDPDWATPDEVGVLQQLLNDHGAELVVDKDYGANTLSAAKAIAKLTGYAGSDVQNVKKYTTHLEDHMSQMLDAIAALDRKFEQAAAVDRKDRNTIKTALQSLHGKVDDLPTAKQNAGAVLGYTNEDISDLDVYALIRLLPMLTATQQEGTDSHGGNHPELGLFTKNGAEPYVWPATAQSEDGTQ